MEALIVTVVGLLLGGWIFGIAGLVRASGAARRVRALEAQLAVLHGQVAAMAQALVAAGFRPPAAAAPPSPPAAEAAPEPAPLAEPPPEPLAEVAEPPQPGALPPWSRPSSPKPGRNIEELLTQRWGVWLGAGALLLAAVFLIRIAVEEGWLGPAARCVLAVLLGLLLILGGEWLARRPVPGAGGLPDHAPAALAAGGVAALFGAAYAAGPLYGLLPPLPGFLAMGAAGICGLLLSLRRGRLVAAVGLAGAFATPALAGSEHGSLPGLFAYLLVVTAAAMLVVRRTAWGWLGWAAAVAGALWVFAGTVLAWDADLWAPALFVPLAAACFLGLLPAEALATRLGARLAHLPPVALGAALLPLAAVTTDLAPAVGVLLLSPVAIAAAARRDGLRCLPFLAAGLGLVLLLVWDLPFWQPTGEAVTIEGTVQAVLPGDWVPAALSRFLALAAALALLNLLAGLALEPRHAGWAGLAAAVPVLTLLVAYARVRGFAADPSWALGACALAALHVAATARGVRAGSDARAGFHAAGATAALALGVAMVLRDQWLTIAIALFLPPLAVIAERLRLEPLRRVAFAVAALVLVRLALNELALGYDWGGTPLLNGLLPAYGLPALCFWWAAHIFLRMRDGRLVKLLECGAALFAMLLVLLEIRHAVQGGVMASGVWPFAEKAWQTTALFAGAWAALLLHRIGGRAAMLWAARAAGLAGLLFGLGLLIDNPWMANEAVGATPLLNALLPAYALPALLVALALGRAPEARRPPALVPVLAAFTLANAFAWVTLEVRRFFHPEAPAYGTVGEAEMYAYSGAWLVLGAALIAIGIRTGRQEIRLAALAVVALTTLKAFLVDMDALVGLWRVLSFLGLGLALIALGAVYRRFVVRAPQA